MTQGMFTAVSGIRANQTRLNVISNNIANVNTLGFKSSLANFATVFASTISGGTGPNGLLGGTNPKQQGNGTMVSEIASNWSQGGAQFTGRSTDLMISGDGFFVVERIDINNGNASTDFYLTRAGNFTLDSNGNLVTSSGNRVRGTSQPSDSALDTLGRINIPLDFNIVKYKDINDTNQITRTYFGAAGTTLADFPAPTAGEDAVPLISNVQLRSFSIGENGSITATYSNGDRISVRLNPDSIAAAPNDPTQWRTEIVHFTYEQQDFAASSTTGVDGQCFQLGGANAVFTGGIPNTTLAGAMEGMQLQLQTATVTNNAGLLYDGNNNFLIGANSGQTFFGVPATGARGSIASGALESSNVDLAGEFTNMVISQRGLEAASKVVRSQSEVLQTIINII